MSSTKNRLVLLTDCSSTDAAASRPMSLVNACSLSLRFASTSSGGTCVRSVGTKAWLKSGQGFSGLSFSVPWAPYRLWRPVFVIIVVIDLCIDDVVEVEREPAGVLRRIHLLQHRRVARRAQNVCHHPTLARSWMVFLDSSVSGRIAHFVLGLGEGVSSRPSSRLVALALPRELCGHCLCERRAFRIALVDWQPACLLPFIGSTSRASARSASVRSRRRFASSSVFILDERNPDLVDVYGGPTVFGETADVVAVVMCRDHHVEMGRTAAVLGEVDDDVLHRLLRVAARRRVNGRRNRPASATSRRPGGR